MSYLGGGVKSSRDKDPFSGKKSQFYVEFLGWMECRGLRGQRYTDPVIRELRRRQKKMDTPPKLTLQVSRKEIKISQDIEEKRKKNIKKIKFPSIPARDVTYVHQATRPRDGGLDDIVACIYLGFMPRTQRYVHVHVYRFDEASTATTFARQMAAVAESNLQHVREVEIELADKGEIEDPRLTSSDGMSEPHTTDSAVGSASSTYSDDDSPTFGSNEIDPDLQSLKDVQPFDNVADELRYRLQMHDSPILLPPKDYDTISRAHGNLQQINQRRCLNLNIVGGMAAGESTRERNGSNESGVDLASPGSDVFESNERVTAEIHNEFHKAHNSSNDTRLSGSPPQSRKPIPSFDGNSPQVSRKPTLLRQDSNGHRVSQHSGSSASTPPPSDKDLVYPPKRNSPPMSPRIYRPSHGNSNSLSRQNSNLSHNSEGSRHSRNSGDVERDEAGNIVYYKGAPNSNDIYALPIKGGSARPSKHPSPREEIPPADYQDDFDESVQMRGVGPRYRQPNLTRSMPVEMLTRSMPADLIRSEMALSGSRPNSGDFRHMRTDSPVFVGGNRTDSPRFGRTDSPRFGPRVDSPVFMAASQPYGLAGPFPSQIQRVHSSKR